MTARINVEGITYISEEQLCINSLRHLRNTKLSETDKYTISDWPHVTEDVKQAYVDYRQALRDLPANTDDPSNPVWPRLTLPTEIDPMDVLRKTRNELLDKTDRYATMDYPHATVDIQQAWFDYRQALRDLPANTADPSSPVWPTPPDA